MKSIPNQGYLNKVKKQMERREEKASMRQLSTSLPLPTTLPNTLPTALPPKLPTGLSAASSAKTTLAPSAESTQSVAANKQIGNKQSSNTQHEMQRLKGLGLTVSVGQVSKPPVAADKAKPQTKVDPSKSLALGQKPGVSGKKAEELGARQLPPGVKKSESITAAAKQASTTAPSYSPAQKLQLKSQVGK